MNIIKLAFQILLFISFSSSTTHTAESKSTADYFPLVKPGCIDTCGNVTIPFPFGIGRECYLDEWYEVVCDGTSTNTTVITRLKKVGVEVLNISLTAPTDQVNYAQGQITVNLPITYDLTSNCSTPSGALNKAEFTDFTGSNFYYSDENLFLSVGCNNSAFLLNIIDASVGCQTKCAGGPESRFYGTCLTGNCCQDKIRSVFFQALNFNFQKDGGVAADSCNYAFLADQSWLKTNVTELEMVRTVGRAPALLDWGVSNDQLKLGMTMSRNSAFGCDADNGVFTRCYCRYGFRGNAYLVNGCQDINECEETSIFFCGDGRECVNNRGSYSCVDRNRTIKLVFIAIGSVIGGFILLFLGRWSYGTAIERKNQLELKQKFFKQNGGLLLQQQLLSPEGSVGKGKLFHSKDLEKASDNFSDDCILGQGGQGTVYRGVLSDGTIVAIKKSKLLDEGNVEQFINEVFILSQIIHRNVVKLLGCCLETEVPLLVYEFIPNGTLYQYLHNPDGDFLISWEVRMRLAIEVAGALAYLHSAASIPIYHRDIKTTNILLDEKYRAKIADFGTSKSVALDQTHVTTLVQGTFGYLDPEYFQSSQFTDKSDVYSFGVVLVELLTGQKPISSLREEEGRSLAAYFMLSMEENRIFDIIDTRLLNQGNKEEIIIVANLARRCLHMKGRSRPTMREVAIELEGVVKRPQQNYDNSELQNESNREMAGFEVMEIEAHGSTFRLAGQNLDEDVSSTWDVSPLLFTDSWCRSTSLNSIFQISSV